MKNVIILIAIIVLGKALQAQNNERTNPQTSNQTEAKGQEKLKQLKIAFLTQKMKLTEKEAQLFWPIYNNYTADRKQINESDKPKYRNLSDENLNESEAQKILDQQIIYEQKKLELEKKYISQFKTVIPTAKIVRMKQAEMEFMKKVKNKIEERQGHHDRNRDQGGRPNNR